MPSEHILVVDDNPFILQLASVVLHHEGYNVSVAHDGESALAQIIQSQPELILLDLQLPGMDGLDLVRELRRNLATCTLPVVALTSHTQIEDRQSALAAGCAAYLTKPIAVRELCAQVRRVLDHQQSQRC